MNGHPHSPVGEFSVFFYDGYDLHKVPASVNMDCEAGRQGQNSQTLHVKRLGEAISESKRRARVFEWTGNWALILACPPKYLFMLFHFLRHQSLNSILV